MWRTSSGIRILARKEAQVFVVGLDGVVRSEEVDLWDDEGISIGIPCFDLLSRGQQLALLAEVASALLKKEVPAPALTATNEAAIATIYGELDSLVTDEPPPQLLQLLRDAATEVELTDIPSLRCTDAEEWRVLVSAFRDRILWDDDWASDLGLPDLPPEVVGDAHDVIGIDRDYYGAVRAVPSKSEVHAARQTLRSLISAGYPDWA